MYRKSPNVISVLFGQPGKRENYLVRSRAGRVWHAPDELGQIRPLVRAAVSQVPASSNIAA